MKAAIRFLAVIALVFVGLIVLLMLASAWLIPEEEEPPPEQMLAFKAAVKPGSIVMYSTDWCVYCKQAKKWLTANEIPFRECDIEASRRCEEEYDAHEGKGVPLFVIRDGEQTTVMSGFSKQEIVESFERVMPQAGAI